jgi:S-ribosylhomocysteine lyase LuxS involved in autoinducer biosynthesis
MTINLQVLACVRKIHSAIAELRESLEDVTDVSVCEMLAHIAAYECGGTEAHNLANVLELMTDAFVETVRDAYDVQLDYTRVKPATTD